MTKDLGTVNGRYQLHHKLGEGGMGIVYRATDRLTGDTVALKQVHLSDKLPISNNLAPNATDDELRLALAHEFQILAGLRHPHIISVLDYGFDGEKRPFFTMTYLPESENILDAAKDAPFERKIELIQQLLQALAYLHRRGVLHRDLKPDNVLVAEGSVRLLDFGLSASDTMSSESIGTPLYLAPELFEDASHSTTADLYAVGVILYQLFTGVHPFVPFDFKFLDRVLAEAPDLEKVDVRLRPFLAQLLAKKPEGRFATASATLIGLAEALNQPPPPETAAIRESYLQAAKFVGREAEMAQLTEALNQAASGKGSAWLIGGESGVGKTRFISELRTQALVSGFQVLRGQTAEDGGFPYEAWREPVRQLVATLPEIDDLATSVLLPLVPDIAQLLNRLVEPAPELKEDAAQARLFTTIARLFWQAERPLLLILEDLHIAEASLLPLPYLTRLVTEYPLLILGSYRSDERPTLPTELAGMTHLFLPRLTADAMSDLSAAMLGDAGRDEAIQALLQRETEGNAFFAVEVVRALAEEAGRLGDISQMTLPETLLPNGIQDIVQRRVSKLSSDARALLVKTAVAGRELELSLIQYLSDGLDIANVWLPLCADAAILEVQNGVWQFSHGKIRDGLLAELSQIEKNSLHDEIALAIETVHPDDETQAVRLAYHWHEAQNQDKECTYVEIAGQQAAAQYAHQDALRYFNRALALNVDDDFDKRYILHEACLEAYRFTGDVDRQQETLHTLAELARSLDDQQKQVAVLIEQGQFYFKSGQLTEAMDIFAQSVEQAQIHNLKIYELRALIQQAIVLRDRRMLTEAIEKLEQASSILEHIDQPLEHIQLCNARGVLASYSGNLRHSIEYHEEALQLSRAQNSPVEIQKVLSNLASTHRMLGEFEQAEAYFQEALKIAQQIGYVYGESILLNNMGIFYSNLGKYERAIATISASLVLSRQVGNWPNYSFSLNNIGVAYHAIGDFAHAKQYLQQAIKQKQALNHIWSEAYSWNMLGHLLLNSEEQEEALNAYQTAESLQANLSQTPTLVETWAGLATTFAHLDNLAKAQQYAEQVWAHLQEKSFDGEWEWAGTALHLYAAFGQLDDGRATAVLQQAYAELQKRAANIATKASREKFRTLVPENRRIIELYHQLADQNKTAFSEQIVGTINGRYHLQTKLGEGGMGTVYRATDRLTGDTVALKQVYLSDKLQLSDSLAPGASEDELRLALAHEFQILAGLRHPHIISVLDYGFDGAKRPFFTMTYLPESENILDAAKDAPFERKIELIQQLLQALAYLHRRGVLHRDLKPDNVLVAEGGVRLLDFGLSATEQIGNDSIGTPLYLAPELFHGQRYTSAADLYAVGVMLYQLLLGQHPFEPFDHKFLDRVLEDAADFSQVDARIRPFLTQLLAKTAEERFPTAPEALFALAAALDQPPPPETAAIRESYLQAAKFVGREAEMAQLTEALNQAASGKGSAWLIGGESGVGKSRLLNELQTQALVAGFQVWRGQAIAEHGAFFQVWQEIVGTLALHTALSELEAGILKEMYPKLELLLGRSIPDVPRLEGSAHLQRLVNTLVGLIQRQKQPVLLLLEDLHWAHESLRPLEQLVYELDGQPLLIVGTYRNDERPKLPTELGRAVQLLTLLPFNESGVQELTEAMLGRAGKQPELVAQLLQETEGNVFFLVEVLRAWAEVAGGLGEVRRETAVPHQLLTGGILQVVKRRLQKVPQNYQPLLRLAAIGGRQLDLNVLARLRETVDLQAWLLACNEAMVLEVTDNTWRFAHDKLREGLLQNLDTAAKKQGHQQVATAIEAIYDHPEEQAVILATHWREAGNPTKEIYYSLKASEQLHHAGNFEQVIELLERLRTEFAAIIDDADSFTVLHLLGEAYRGTNQYTHSLARCQAALVLARQRADQQAIVNQLIGLGWSIWGQLQYEDRLRDKAGWEAAEACFQEALPLAETLGDQVGMGRCLHNLGLVFAVRDRDVKKGLGYMQRGLHVVQAVQKPEYLLISLYDIGLFTMEHDLAAGKAYFFQALALAHEVGRPRIIRYILQSLTNVALFEADWPSFERHLQELTQFSKNRRDFFYTAVNRLAAILAIHRGELDLAQHHIGLNLNNHDRPHLDTTFEHCQQGAVALLRADRAQLTDSLTRGLSNVKKAPVAHVAYLAALQAGAYLLAAENEKGGAWLSLAEAHLTTSANRVQERAHHVTDVLAQLRHKFQTQLATDAVQADQARAAQLSLATILAEWTQAEPDSPSFVQAVESMLFGQLETINGRYQLHQKLGEGGMGTVYRATDRLTGETVALKQVHLSDKLQISDSLAPGATEDDLRLALAHEFQILAGLRHPHIISVLDYGFDEGKRPFFTMTYLPQSQNILAAAQDQSFERKIELIQQLLQALAYLHRRGVLHRDLKPDNVQVVDGNVRVLDFGLAASDTFGSDTIGTPLYMPPEKIDGGEFTSASDLYAVGVISYQMLVGVHPFAPIDHKFLDRVLEEAPDLTVLDVRLRPFFNQLLHKQPEHRPDTAHDALIILATALNYPQPKESAVIRESYLQAAKFVGRKTEMAQLNEALQQAKNSYGTAWLIGGESGVGKSRLLDEVRVKAMVRGWQVLSGHQPEDLGLPYQLWREIIQRLALNTEITDREASILKEILPEIDHLLGRSIPVLPTLSGAERQERLIRVFIDLLQRQDQSTLLLLEDLQWAEESLSPLASIVDMLDRLPGLMIIGTYRNDERPDLPSELPKAQPIALARLSEGEVQQLSQAMLGQRASNPEIVSLLTQETEGNTFFIVEVMRALAEEAGQLDEISHMNLPAEVLTSGMAALLQRRIQRVSPTDKPLLEAAAVAGKQLDISLLTVLASGAERVLEGWLQRISETTILTVFNNQWYFSHDKLRKTIINNLSEADRKHWHRQVAEAIEKLYPDETLYHQALFEHWHEVGDIDKETGYLDSVAQYLIEVRADYITAEKLLERGINLLPNDDSRRITLLSWQIKACMEQYDTEKFKQALDLAKQSLQLAEQENDPVALATSLHHLGDITYELDSTDESAFDYVQKSLTQARSIGDKQRISENLILLGEMSHNLGRIDEAIGFFQDALPIIKALKSYYNLGYTLDQLGQTSIIQGKYEQAAEYLAQSYAAFKEGGYEQRLGWNLLNMSTPPLLLGRYDEANDYLNRGRAVFERYDIHNGIAFSFNNLGRVATLTEEYEEARNYLLQAVEMFRATGIFRGMGYCLLQLGLLMMIQGNYEEAEEYLQQSLTGFEELDDLRFVAYSLARLGIVYLYLKPDLVQETFHQALEMANSLGIEPCVLEIVFGFSLLRLQQGKPFAAGELAGLAEYHPRSNKETQLYLRLIDPELKKSLSADDLARAKQNGKSFDLDHVVHSLLEREALLSASQSSFQDGLDDEMLNGQFDAAQYQRYQLTQKLGEGGMGIVYRATDRLTGDTVALKQVHLSDKLQISDSLAPGATEDDLRLALAHEFQILAGLRHPHIISVLDYGFDGAKRPYFTMTYLPESQNILEAAKDQPFDRKIELIQQLLQALAYLHRRGVLHRDLKPDNILVADGSVRLLDFGLSASDKLGSDSIGTPLYMAPELFEEASYSQPADLYAAGVVLYQLLTGQHPFAPFDHKFLDRVLESAPDLEAVDERIRPFLHQLLAKTPQERFATAPDALLALAAALDQPPPPETAAIRESYLQAAKFVGREAEMSQLTQALEQAANGHGSAWLIGGESGVGKTRLISELRTQALVNGFQVLHGQMSQEGSLPYEAWREPVRHLVATLPKIDPFSASVLLPLVPDIEELIGSAVSPAPELAGAAAQTRLFTTIASLLRQADWPLLILLEDLQWSKESLQPIPFITRTIKDHAVVLIGSYRHDEQPDLPQRVPDMQLLSLPRFTVQEMSELSRAMLGDIGQQENVLTLIQQETEGNAFFAVEVVRALAEDVGKLRAIGQMPLPEQLLPKGIQNIIERRLERIPAAARPLLQLAAVAGRELDIKLIEALANAVDVPTWWLPSCSNAAVLEVRNGRWQFSHDKIRQVVLMAVPAATRAAHHGQIADALTIIYPEQPEMATQIAHHWQAAGNNEQEQRYRLVAANYAQEQFAYDDLLAHLDRVLVLTHDSDQTAYFDILTWQIKTLHLVGEADEESKALTKLIALAEETNEAEKIVVARIAQVEFLNVKGDFDTLNQLAQETADRFAEQVANKLVDLYPAWAWSKTLQGSYDEALSILDRAQPLLDGSNTFAEVRTIANRGTIAQRMGKYEEAIQAHSTALALAQKLGSPNRIISVLNNLASSYMEQNKVDKAVDYFEQALQLNQRVGNQIYQISLLINLGICRALLHDYALSQSLTKQALTLGETVGNQINVAIAAESLGHTSCFLGHFEEGLNYAQYSLGIIEKIAKNDAYLMGDIWQVMADNLFYLGRFDEAEEAYQAALTFRKELGVMERQAQTKAGLVRTILAKGEPERSLTALQAVLTFLDTLDAPDFSTLNLYLACYDVLKGNGLPEADTYLRTAYRLLETEAEKIEQDESRQIFWETHVVHREVVRLYAALRALADTAVSTPPVLETINGRYHLHTKLGEGGMGTVYRATDRLTGDTVALKQVHLSDKLQISDSLAPGATEDDLRLALAHEFQILAGLRHPHIISVLDYGFDGAKRPYFTMTYLPESQNILEAAKDQPFDRKIELIQQLLQALAYLHRRGVLHRDLKPDNVLVVNDHVRVLDFGLSISEKTSSESLGTPLYLAPEIFQGEPFTPAADLHAVGVLLYQFCTGNHPFAPFDHSFLDRLLKNAPDLAHVNEPIRPFLARLLAKTADERFATAPEALFALAAALNQPAPPETAAIRESYLQAAKFVGRKAELAQLTAALPQAARGAGSTWLIGGESGVGKSRLLSELRTLALVNGFLVIQGQAERDGGIPYQIWREPVRRLVLTTDLSDVEAGILKEFIPDLPQLLARVIPNAPTLTGSAHYERLLFTILAVFRRQQTPVLLLVEDLHWTQESLIWLKTLSQLVKRLSLLIVGTYRDDERPDLPQLLPQAQVIKLSRLNKADIASLTEAMLGPAGTEPALLNLLQQETEGNIFFMVEVMRALATEAGDLSQVGQMTLPQAVLAGGVQDVLQRRIGRMPEWGRPLLQLAAVYGRQFDLHVLSALAPHTELSPWLTVGAEVALFDVQEDQWRFSHDKLREAVLADLPQAAQKSLHRQVAKAIEQLYPDDETRSAQLMEHWRNAGDIAKELPYILKFVQQVSHSRNDFQYALELIARGFSLAEQLQDVPVQLELAIMQGSTHDGLGEYAVAQSCFEQALPKIQALGLSRLERRAHNTLAHVAWQRGNQQAMVNHATQAFALSRKMDDASGLVHSLNQMGLAYDNAGDLAKARDYYHQCLEVARNIEKDHYFASIALNNIGEGLTDEGDYLGAHRYYLEAYEIDQRRGDRHGVAVMLANLGNNALARGDWSEARRYLEESIQIQRDFDLETSLGLALNSMVVVELIAGEHVAAERCVMENLALAEALGNRLYQPEALLWLGHVRLAQQKTTEALAAYNQAVDAAREVGQTVVLADTLAGRALAQTDMLAAGQDLREALTLAQQNNLGRLRINALTSFANLYRRQGELAQAAALCGLLDAQGDFDHQAIRLLYRMPLVADLRAKLGEAVYEAASQQLLGQRLADVAQALLDEQLPVVIPAPLPDAVTTAVSIPPKTALSPEELIEQILDEATGQSPRQKLRGEALLTHLLAVSRRMATMRSLAPLLSYALNEVIALVGAERGYIVLINDDGTLDFRVRRRADGADIQSDADTISNSILAEVVRNQQSLVVRNALLDPRFGAAHSVVAMQLRSIMCAPLITQDRIIGAIYVESRSRSGRFTEDDLAPLEFFSNQAAVAIENANLNENLEELVAERTWELAEAKELAEAANEAKTSFLSNMSHELRTPLNAILNFTGFVYDGLYGEVNAEQQHALQQALDSGEHLLSLINDILDLNKIEAGMMRLVFEAIDMNKIMHHAVSTAKGLVKDQPIALVVDIEPDLPVIQADRRRLRQILLNILSNAAKYTEQGSITITASHFVEAACVEIRIQDTGVGIAAKDHHLVFEAYGQARANVGNVVSTGLGMAITYDLVQLHNGRIWFTSEENVGTTFFVQLPIQQAA